MERNVFAPHVLSADVGFSVSDLSNTFALLGFSADVGFSVSGLTNAFVLYTGSR